jgi:hypothetical protein
MAAKAAKEDWNSYLMSLITNQGFQQTQIDPTQKAEIQTNKARKVSKLFNEEEDKQLLQLVSIFGVNCWGVIAVNLKKTAHECKKRYYDHLAPTIKNTDWTDEEEKLLQSKVAEYGTHWEQIYKYFPNRGQSNIRNHWKCMAKLRSKKFKVDTEINYTMDSEGEANLK